MVFSSSAPQPPPASGWAGLPRDVLWSVFTALGQREVLSGAGLACAPWWRLARHEPAFWRQIDLTTAPDDFTVEVDDDEDTSDEESMWSLFGGDDDDLQGGQIDLTTAPDDFTLEVDDDEDTSDEESMWNLFGGDDDDLRGGQIDLTTARDDFTLEVDDDEDTSDEESMWSLFGGDDDDLPVPIRICEEKTPSKDCDDSSAWKAMALAAVDRSSGKCEAFWGRADVEVLLYLADRASSMKSLRVASHYDVSSEVFAELIKKFPLLEELELVLKYDAIDTKSEQPFTNSLVELFQSTCKACCHLQHFTVRCAGKKQGSDSPTHFSIPMMHGLHSVELSGDSLTKDVVMQIVDNCPSLKSLNISDVHYQDRWDEKLLRNKCYRIKNLRLPSGDGGYCCGE
ncbi:hypothetical protein SETIT_3G316900v2 [Setaria italica]|uniref:Uncharacterized protein n=1 Tax=Setaria italica TaxID=4555 RepID=A0A368QKX3_SETIT|nr:hypothetical protein SETIT_3G316900v2 [Setaria italica]